MDFCANSWCFWVGCIKKDIFVYRFGSHEMIWGCIWSVVGELDDVWWMMYDEWSSNSSLRTKCCLIFYFSIWFVGFVFLKYCCLVSQEVSTKHQLSWFSLFAALVFVPALLAEIIEMSDGEKSCISTLKILIRLGRLQRKSHGPSDEGFRACKWILMEWASKITTW